MKMVMGYVYALSQYFRTDKGRHDLLDYIRAVVIIASVMAMVRVLWDIILTKGLSVFVE